MSASNKNSQTSQQRVVCYCKRPAKECIVSKPGVQDFGRPYYICEEGECDFHRWADVVYKNKKDRPQDPHIIGTAFTEEDKEEKTLPVWEQVVTDEKGKRRFHGAFTGGFSAGYWNTVGSAEGWQPSNFSSSRNARATVQQDVRKYMDEEDLKDELMGGEAIKAKSKFSSFGTADELQRKQNSVLFGALNDLIIPAKDPVGVKLLRLMGWREGHGVGAKRFKLQKEVPKKVIGPQVPAELLNNIKPNQIEEEENMELFAVVAPKNTTSVEYAPKNDSYGIDFDPFTSAPEFRSELEKRKESRGGDTQKKASTKGFGLGAFEDADDEEVYNQDNMEMYDKVLGEPEAPIKEPNPTPVKEKPAVPVDTKKCSDGSFPLRNFRISTKLEDKSVWFPPPQVPANWKPPQRNGNESQIEQLSGSRSGTITPQERGALLGERQLPSSQQPSSVFAFLAPEDHSRLSALTGRFTSSAVETFNSNPTQSLTEWQQTQEAKQKKVFEDTAAKFKPLSDAMASRFTKATEVQGPKQTLEGHQAEQYQETAAEMQMFGKLTRNIEEWYPSGLLCKRFNLKNPHPGKKRPEKKQTSDLLTSVDLPFGAALPPSQEELVETQNKIELVEDNVIAPLEGDSDGEGKEEVVTERPPIDFFKSIFEDSDEEELQHSTEVLTEHRQLITEAASIKQQDIVSIGNSALQENIQIKDNSINHGSLLNTLEHNKPNPYLFYPPKQDSRGAVQLQESKQQEKKEKENKRSHGNSKEKDIKPKDRHSHKDKKLRRD